MWDVALAKEIKKRDNQEYIGVIVGIVVGVNPIKVSIYNGSAIFSGNNLYVCEKVNGYTEVVNMTIDGTTQQATIEHEGVKAGDRVTCIATQDNQKLFVIDKLS